MSSSGRVCLTLAVLVFMNAPVRADAPREALSEMARSYVAAHASSRAAAEMVPSFARQTGLACSACHFQFLGLTPFGRKFKLNGYTLTDLVPIVEKDSATVGGKLKLTPTSLVAAMLTGSLTHLSGDLPGTQNDAAILPQEFSLFVSGQISSHVGLFSQLTYGGADGEVGIDNIDLRYAGQASLGNTQMIYGFTLHNNPTIQDLWNTTPGWSFPFLTSEGAPTGLAATLIDGELEQNVLGLGSYAMIGNTVYGEFSVYRSAQQGTAAPTTGAIHGAAPYWRFALQKDWDRYYLMVGTYGLHVSAFPDVLSGPRDSYTDVGVDAQFEAKVGRGNIVGRGTLIHESAKLDGTFALGGSANTKDKLNTLRLSASWYPRQLIGLTGAFFQTTGTNDPVRYAPAAVDGSASGDPETRGFTVELDVNPWENTRLGAQFTAYSRFNGGSTNYDGSGRKASDNNTLFLYTWIAF